MSAQPIRDATVRLHDGRALAYCEWGRTEGPAVLAFHGSPGSRVWWPGLPHTEAAGVRLVTVDRPGCGNSDPLPGRTIGGWAGDVAELTEALGIGRFGVVGWSGGAPYAASVAASMPDRLTGTCIVSSASITYTLGPTTPDEEDEHLIDMIRTIGHAEATLRYVEENRAWAEGLLKDPASLTELDEIAEGDRWLFDDPAESKGLNDMTREAVRQGAIGACSDWIGLLAPWGFSLNEIEAHVHLWHGGQDTWVDRNDFERVAAEIPHSTLTVWPDAGHFGIAKHWSDVLGTALG
jgi:pimeloyl-ACP methyl ester carboxylesterase